MKIRIHRIARSEGYTDHDIDHNLMEGTIRGNITPGEPISVQFARPADGEWCTTRVVRIEYHKDGVRLVHTKNSIYVVVPGWRD